MGQDENDLFSNWYVLNVNTGREFFVMDRLGKYAAGSIRMLVFQREIIHSRNGGRVKVTGALFSGYIFVHEKIDAALHIARTYLNRERIIPVATDHKPCRVFKNEMELLLTHSDPDGLFRISHGIKVGDKVEIVDGFLMHIPGNIVWIDEKKHKAKVEIDLFRRKMRVNLGLEIVRQG